MEKPIMVTFKFVTLSQTYCLIAKMGGETHFNKTFIGINKAGYVCQDGVPGIVYSKTYHKTYHFTYHYTISKFQLHSNLFNYLKLG